LRLISNRDIALTALADTAGMSPHYFSELFKRSVHFSPYQYVLRRRIEHAQKLLHEPAVTVFEAAVRSGFSDQSQVAKLFRRLVGVTPTGYRAALQAQGLRFRNQGFDVVYVSQMDVRGLPIAKPTDPLRKFTELYPPELHEFARKRVPAGGRGCFLWQKRLPCDWHCFGAGGRGRCAGAHRQPGGFLLGAAPIRCPYVWCPDTAECSRAEFASER
jgi:AraC-like DNA-binding protein